MSAREDHPPDRKKTPFLFLFLCLSPSPALSLSHLPPAPALTPSPRESARPHPPLVAGLELAKSSYFSAIPWATMAVSGVLAGTLADALIARGVSVTVVRKFTQGVGFIGPALSLVWLALVASDAASSLAALTVAIGCTAFTQAGFLVNFQEIGPRYVGALHGMANTAGSIAGIVGTYGAGWVLERTGSWNAVLLITAGVYAAGAAAWLAFSTGERVFD